VCGPRQLRFIAAKSPPELDTGLSLSPTPKLKTQNPKLDI
jgi:hypothetical protein